MSKKLPAIKKMATIATTEGNDDDDDNYSSDSVSVSLASSNSYNSSRGSNACNYGRRSCPLFNNNVTRDINSRNDIQISQDRK